MQLEPKLKESGFTLIELLAASTLIGIIITAVLLFINTSVKSNINDENLTIAQNDAQIIMDFARNKMQRNLSACPIHLAGLNIQDLVFHTNASPGASDWNPISSGSMFQYFLTTGSTILGTPATGETVLVVEVKYPNGSGTSIYSLATKIRQ